MVDLFFCFAFNDSLFLAERAEAAQEALSHADGQSGCDDFWIDVEVDETRKSSGSGICVQCREDEVAGERRVDGDVSRLVVADFTDHDDVGVLTHRRTQTLEEIVAFVVDLGLCDAGQMVFDRVFDGDYLDPGIV